MEIPKSEIKINYRNGLNSISFVMRKLAQYLVLFLI
jgi:hypothetical protein